MDGGIFGFLGLIASHRGAIEYDWRTRFHAGLHQVGVSMSISEAARHAVTLAADPSSATAAAVEGWDHPISRTDLILMDLYDRYADVNFKKPQPYPGRPWSKRPEVTRLGNAAGRTSEQVRAILDANRRGYRLDKRGRLRDERGRFVKS